MGFCPTNAPVLSRKAAVFGPTTNLPARGFAREFCRLRDLCHVRMAGF